MQTKTSSLCYLRSPLRYCSLPTAFCSTFSLFSTATTSVSQLLTTLTTTTTLTAEHQTAEWLLRTFDDHLVRCLGIVNKHVTTTMQHDETYMRELLTITYICKSECDNKMRKATRNMFTRHLKSNFPSSANTT